MTLPRTVSDSFARPADTTQYASGDLVADSTTAGSVTALTFGGGDSGLIRRVLLTKDDDDTTSALFRLHLFSSDPTTTAPANGDNGAISLNTAIADYIGSFDFDMSSSPDIYNSAGNLAVGVPLKGQEAFIPAGTNTIYGLLEARGTYTPASGETFTVRIERLTL
jgi:hypothetical protein